MKKVKAVLICSFVFAALVTFGQDSTKLSDEAVKQREGPGVGAQTQEQSHDDREDRTVVEKRQVPANLRSRLQDDKYKGWEENATIYKLRDNDSFIVEMKEGDQVKEYRFDKDAKPVKDF